MLGINGIDNNFSPYTNSINSGATNPLNSKITDELRAEGKSEALGKNLTSERSAKRAGVIECETCATRKYQDGSDEQVSFKSAAHISPNAAASRVRGHEQEHVNNAYDKAKQGNGKVLQASVSIHTAICPECGRTYVSGGTTHTKIAYPNEDNPYQKNRKEADNGLLSGMIFDMGV
ncbi:MAG: hypothetical protein K6E79_08535 [Pseudobutyrivibrio sp.]|nr:hypothetical protein [Pseudobutyrivibrio sp.]